MTTHTQIGRAAITNRSDVAAAARNAFSLLEFRREQNCSSLYFAYLFARLYNAIQDTKTITRVAFQGAASNIVLDYVLMCIGGEAGIAFCVGAAETEHNRFVEKSRRMNFVSVPSFQVSSLQGAFCAFADR